MQGVSFFIIKNIIIVVLLVLPLSTYADCTYVPEHTFEIKVRQCNPIVIGPGGLKTSFGNKIDMQGESASGTILSGWVMNNNYDWEGNPKHEWFDEWKDDSFRTVFLFEEAKSICNRESGFELRLKVLWPCCDTSPQAGFCFVPSNIPIVEIQN